MKKAIKVVVYLILIFLVVVLFILPRGFFGIRPFVVMSSSMEPTLMTGSLIFSKEIQGDSLGVGEVITFIRPDKSREFVTHRIVDLEDTNGTKVVITKGDNNSENDSWKLAQGGVVGKVILALPYLGYVLTFVKSKLGLFLFVVLPALFVIYEELRNIFKIVKGKKKSVELVVLMILGLHLSNVSNTSSIMNDTVSLTNNVYTVGLDDENEEELCDRLIEAIISGNGSGSVNEIDININCSISVTSGG